MTIFPLLLKVKAKVSCRQIALGPIDLKLMLEAILSCEEIVLESLKTEHRCFYCFHNYIDMFDTNIC